MRCGCGSSGGRHSRAPRKATGTRAEAGEEEKGLSSQVADVDYAPDQKKRLFKFPIRLGRRGGQPLEVFPGEDVRSRASGRGGR